MGFLIQARIIIISNVYKITEVAKEEGVLPLITNKNCKVSQQKMCMLTPVLEHNIWDTTTRIRNL